MSGGEVGLLMLTLFILTILLGFPIVFTLMGMGVSFGYYAYATPDQIHHILDNRIFDLLVQNTFSILSNDTLTAVPLFLFMGYVVERANILDRLFYSIQMAARKVPGSLAVATLITCALFATAAGIIGAVVTLMGLLALPAMLKAGYDTKLAAGVICAGGCLGIMIPPSILLILYAATAGESVVKLYAGAFIPGFLLAGFYILYVIIRAIINPKLAPKLPDDEGRIPPLEVFWALLTSFFPLAVLIMSVLGAILLGLATPTEAAAIGSFGALLLAAGYRELDFTAVEGSRVSHRPYLRDGDLSLHRLLDLRLGVRLSRRPGGGRGTDQGPEHEPGRVPDAHPGHHLPARLAVGMDRDHHHLRADLPAAVEVLPRRSDLVRHFGGAEHPDLVQHAADGDGRLLSKGRGAAPGAAGRDLQRLAAVRVHGVHHHGAALYLSRTLRSGCRINSMGNDGGR